MADHTPVGEDAWMALVDEASRSAADLEQRVGVVELYKTAVGGEPWSTKLWLAYCEWFWSLHTDCQTSDAGWPEEEQMLGREIFSVDQAREVWQQGAQATQYRLNDSHEVWNRWMSIELEEHSKSPTQSSIGRIRQMFEARLQIPHATWDNTSQMFSTFISKYDEAAWESTMVKVTQLARTAKELYSHREEYELKLHQALDSGGIEAQQIVMREYLDWEDFETRKKNKKGIYTNPAILCVALYERALSSAGLGLDTGVWEDYITYLYLAERDNRHSGLPTIRSVVDRATSHCPWYGPLWARYILSAESDGLDFSDIEQIKHAATSTGKLDREGMNAVLDVYAAWCGYLRRRTVVEGANDDAPDVAEFGFQSALESVQVWGERLYGKEYKGDPAFRIERVVIAFLTQKGSIAEARNVWRKLSSTHADGYEFWQQYYLWEMTVRDPNVRRPGASSLATAVLIKAVQRKTLDWPEKMLEVYVRHCSNYEDAQTLSVALDTAHRANKNIAKRRQKEADAAAALYAQQQSQVVVESIDQEDAPSGASKRKRVSASEELHGTTPKKIKNEQHAIDQSTLHEQHLKRDRENTSVLVTNLPTEVTQTKVRQYFKEYGHINSLTIKTEAHKTSSTGLIEFSSTEDVQSALLRDGKYFGENQIHVEPGTGLTLYVTNYPPTADEAYFREFFKDCGEIFSIRWPSLKFNTQRRFCYISFRSRDAAAAATQFDGKQLENGYRLTAKYSDPTRKKAREGATAEGREVHVTSLDSNTSEAELKEVFSKYGKVEGVRILRNMAGKSKGGAFVDFVKKEDAESSCELNGIKFKTQILKVEISRAINFKPTATTGKGSSTSPAPDVDSDSGMSPSPTPNLQHMNTGASQGLSKAEITGRTITLMNIPDTVNDARVRALVEPYGPIVKFVLRLDHSGAIVEFADVKDAGRAALGLENHEVAPGRKLRTGGLKDLFQEKDEKRTDRIQVGQGKKATTGFMQPSAPVRRPGAGGRGGLGAKRGLGYSAPKVAPKPEGSSNSAANGEENVKPKSNADFKKMFLSGRKE